jgi:hypothetical protein
MAPPRKTHWECRGEHGKACGYWVPLGTMYCNSCGHSPPAHVAQKPAKKEGAEIGGRAAKPPAAGKAKGKGKGAAEYTNGATQDAKKFAAEKAESAKLRAQLKEAAAKCAKLEADAGANLGAAHPAAGAMDVDAAGDDCTLAAAADKAREEVVQFKKIPESLRVHITGFDETLARLEATHESALAAKRNAKPLKQQLAEAEGWHDRAVKRADAAKAALAEQKEQARVLAESIEANIVALAALDAAVASAKAQVAVLGAQRNAERIGEPPLAATAPPASEELISRAFAEKVWTDHMVLVEKEKADLRNQLEAALHGGNGTPSEASPSEATDIGSIASLDGLADDDTAWGKCDKAQRKKMLARHSATQRSQMAKDVKATFNSFNKTLATSSPFAKK